MEDFNNIFKDGFTQLPEDEDINNTLIKDGFVETQPFLNEEQAERKRKEVGMKILLENVRSNKGNASYIPPRNKKKRSK